jgi:hypothetical protein
MARRKIRLLVVATLSVGAGGLFLTGAGQAAGAAATSVASAATASAATASAATASAATGTTVCIAHRPNYSSAHDIEYAPGCTGHDEPELDPVSSLPGSAKDLTWTAVLPKDGKLPVSDVGPTFWWGGTVTDANPIALFNQAFLELQFYPDAIVTSCTPDGGFNVVPAKNKFTVCSPVWQVEQEPDGSLNEDAAFNAELFDGHSSKPLVMNAGDTIQVHFFMVAKSLGWFIHVTDLSTHDSGTIVLNSQYGPLQPAFGKQQIGNALGWGSVNDTPNAFVWEIGHTSNFATPPGDFCLPGDTRCDSYDQAHWLGFTPLRIKSVTFANGSRAKQWAVVSDFGGTAEINQYCPAYGGPFCIYPWYAFNGRSDALTYGADYPGTRFDYGMANQFATAPLCGGPFGPDSTYCVTPIKPVPLR